MNMLVTPAISLNFGMKVIYILFSVMFGLFLLLVITYLVKVIKSRRDDRMAPLLTMDAKVIAKRMQVGHKGAFLQDMDAASTLRLGRDGYTRYFMTFEAMNGDRLELAVDRKDYGLLIEGDHGALTYKGSRLISFERN
ncbi:MAG: DUF2500 domain-containing protein [Clostridiaceae bacterium]|nr:DUF2500 domain-containing protein [Clostridiaceae bacterium]